MQIFCSSFKLLRMTYIVLLVAGVIGFSMSSMAFFSQLVVISPKNSNKYSANVRISDQVDKNGFYDVEVHGIKHVAGWVITTSEPTPPSEQAFRNQIWSFFSFLKFGFSKTQVFQSENTQEMPTVKVHRDKIERSYLYFDYPSKVMDGGFYYSVDLSEFFKAK